MVADWPKLTCFKCGGPEGENTEPDGTGGHIIWQFHHKPNCEFVRGRVNQAPQHDPVNHPAHYTTGSIEVIDFIEDKQLPYHLGNVIKYVVRAPHKGNELQDLEKASWYLNRAISLRRKAAK